MHGTHLFCNESKLNIEDAYILLSRSRNSWTFW